MGKDWSQDWAEECICTVEGHDRYKSCNSSSLDRVSLNLLDVCTRTLAVLELQSAWREVWPFCKGAS